MRSILPTKVNSTLNLYLIARHQRAVQGRVITRSCSGCHETQGVCVPNLSNRYRSAMKHAVCAKAKRDCEHSITARLGSAQITIEFTSLSSVSLTFMQTGIQYKPRGSIIYALYSAYCDINMRHFSSETPQRHGIMLINFHSLM